MEVTGYAKQSIYNKSSKNQIPTHGNGKLIFSRSELEEWMKEKKSDDNDIISKYPN